MGLRETIKFKKILEKATCASFRAEGIPFDENELPMLRKIARNLRKNSRIAQR